MNAPTCRAIAKAELSGIPYLKQAGTFLAIARWSQSALSQCRHLLLTLLVFCIFFAHLRNPARTALYQPMSQWLPSNKLPEVYLCRERTGSGESINSLAVLEKSIGHINGLSRVDILAGCAPRPCRTVEVSIYWSENPARGVGQAIPVLSILNERAQPPV